MLKMSMPRREERDGVHETKHGNEQIMRENGKGQWKAVNVMCVKHGKERMLRVLTDKQRYLL